MRTLFTSATLAAIVAVQMTEGAIECWIVLVCAAMLIRNLVVWYGPRIEADIEKASRARIAALTVQYRAEQDRAAGELERLRAARRPLLERPLREAS